MSGLRGSSGVVTTADSLLRHDRFADDHAPDVVVRVGRPAASKVLASGRPATGLVLVQVGGPGVIDPAHNVRAVCSIDRLLAAADRSAHRDDVAGALAHADARPTRRSSRRCVVRAS